MRSTAEADLPLAAVSGWWPLCVPLIPVAACFAAVVAAVESRP